jgi:hypothetical protein
VDRGHRGAGQFGESLEDVLAAARTSRVENAALRGVIRKTLALLGTTGPVPTIKAGDDLLVSLRSDLSRFAA